MSSSSSSKFSTTLTVSSTLAASIFYLCYNSRKNKRNENLKKYLNKGGEDEGLHLDLVIQQSLSDSSDLSYEQSQSLESGLSASSLPDIQENEPVLSATRPTFLGMTWGADDDDLSYRPSTADTNFSRSSFASFFASPSKCIYLDYNGTTPIHPRVVAAMQPFFTVHFGNPSSSHFYGSKPKEAIVAARKSILGLLHPNHLSKIRLQEEQDAIIFLGCGTEADNLAIHAAIQSQADQNKKHHVVTSNVEHPAIMQYLKALEKKGSISVTYCSVDKEGCVSADDVIDAIRPDETILVTLMLANNESGALQPVKEVAKYCREKSILFHTDAAQAVGKVSIALDETGISDCVDMITIVGHKFGAPKGIACLYVRPHCFSEGQRRELDSSDYMLLGGGQEGGRRAGTENVPYIVALGTAADILTAKTKYRQTRWKKNAQRMESMRNRLLKNLTEALGEDIVKANGPAEASRRLPNTLSVGIKNIQSGELLREIQTKLACSAGSACHSSGGSLSPVLCAMKVPEEFARGTLRLSVGPDTRQDDVDEASRIIIKEVERQLRKKSESGKSQ